MATLILGKLGTALGSAIAGKTLGGLIGRTGGKILGSKVDGLLM